MSEIRSPYPAELRECMIAPVRVGIRTDLTIYPPSCWVAFSLRLRTRGGMWDSAFSRQSSCTSG